MSSAAIINILKDCGCYEYKEYFAGLKSKDDLYRFSLKELGLILPPGQAGRWAAYTIHNHLYLLQREEFQGWVDPRNQLQYLNHLPSSSSQSQGHVSLQLPSGDNAFHNQLKSHHSTSTRTTTTGGGRSRERESKYESSPHFICTQEKDGKKMYACKYCDRKFSAPNQATIHSRKHTGEKPYSCDECNKQFSQISSRNLHVRTHHQD